MHWYWLQFDWNGLRKTTGNIRRLEVFYRRIRTRFLLAYHRCFVQDNPELSLTLIYWTEHWARYWFVHVNNIFFFAFLLPSLQFTVFVYFAAYYAPLHFVRM
jgi:hypothetical protein